MKIILKVAAISFLLFCISGCAIFLPPAYKEPEQAPIAYIKFDVPNIDEHFYDVFVFKNPKNCTDPYNLRAWTYHKKAYPLKIEANKRFIFGTYTGVPLECSITASFIPIEQGYYVAYFDLDNEKSVCSLSVVRVLQNSEIPIKLLKYKITRPFFANGSYCQ